MVVKYTRHSYGRQRRTTLPRRTPLWRVCRHGIAEKLRSDNGTQFASREFALFCKDYQIDHYTSSPAFPQSNCAAERAVQIVKRLWAWRKCTDKHLALLDYRTTPLESCHLSPAQLCMSCRPRNKLPIARELLRPTAYDVTKVRCSLTDDTFACQRSGQTLD